MPPFLVRLGLGPDAGVRDVRRAYARELRQIDQEADPRGFQALREAYEAALRWAERVEAGEVPYAVYVPQGELGDESEDEDEGEEWDEAPDGARDEERTASEAPEDAERPRDPGWSRRPRREPSAAPPDPEPPPDPGWSRGRAIADPPEASPAPPQALAGAVLAELSAAMERGFRDELDANDALARCLADPRLLGIEARHEFEARIAGLLAGGYRPGHEHLLPAATARFEWRGDRRRLSQLGAPGREIDAALEEELVFDGLGGEARRYREIAQRLREDQPPEDVLVALAPVLERLRVRFPSWLRLVVPAEAIGRWQRWYAEIPPARRAPRPPTSVIGPPRRRSPIAGIALIAAVALAMARLASMGSSSSSEAWRPAPPPPIDLERLLREHPEFAERVVAERCDGGEPEACRQLAHLYLAGGEGRRDPARAAQTLRRACSASYGVACLALGDLTAGNDPAHAAVSYERACDRQLGRACAALAALYEEGKGVTRDPERAAALRRRACDAGEAAACPRPPPRRPKRAGPAVSHPEQNPALPEDEPRELREPVRGPTEGTTTP